MKLKEILNKSIKHIPGLLKLRFSTKLLLSLIMFSLAANLYSQNFQKIIPLDSDIYKYIDNIYLEQGMAYPSTARPWSEDELIHIIDSISKNRTFKGREKKP